MGQSTRNATLLLKCCTVVEMLLKEMKECPRPIDTKENNELMLPYEEGNRKEVCELLVHSFGCAHFKEDRNHHRKCGSLLIFLASQSSGRQVSMRPEGSSGHTCCGQTCATSTELG